MAEVLTAAAVLQCPHGAPVVFVAGQSRLTVGADPVLVDADVSAATVPTCPASSPCAEVTLSGGAARGLRADGAAALLKTSTLRTNNGDVTVVEAGQSTLLAD